MSALDDVAAERRRQIEVEEWTEEHDDSEHARGELSAASAAYSLAASAQIRSPYAAREAGGFSAINPPPWWPDRWTFKPADPRRMLVKAGALIIAEIERLDREKRNA